jgi:hypothetical protein
MSGVCRLERDVIRAAAEDRWSDSLRRHADECPDCAAAASVSPWMRGLARTDERTHILPDPAVVWLKAQLLRGTAVIDRAARPMAISQLIAYMTVAAGWAALLTWKWNALQTWLQNLTPGGFVASASGSASQSGAASLTASFFTLIIALSSVTVMLALHTILAEE